jgi:predicted ATPase/class 3 adenylate cyclase
VSVVWLIARHASPVTFGARTLESSGVGGDPDATIAPAGTVTFLFTDLQGSTRLWEEHSEAMRSALARHDEIVREAIVGHRGYVVKTTGDGFHAAFAAADDAIRAALAAQLALGHEPWVTPEPLRARMGIHTGPAEARDGDYYGPTLNRAARLMAAAHGGQVVVSLATEELVRDRIGQDTSLCDLGEHRLRDVPRPERVFQVVHPELPFTFPPLNSIDPPRGNLPSQLTTFVGRETERAAITDALEQSRFVTITGVGGVGKTRLALEIAGTLQPVTPDGVWLCELAPASDADALEQVVARAVTAAPRPGLSLAQSIVEYLRNRTVLVVFDNCEHLIDDAGRLAEAILRECPGVRILATSREGLSVPGERVWPLRSLPVPGSEAPVDATLESAAVQLFAERARAARPGFALDGTNAGAVAEVCRRLDGIPLAIELAAARTVAMTPGEIAALLDERFRLLTGGRRSGVERHQTLRAAVDWSYSLLMDAERTVFDRLGVFAGSFDTTAATDVVGGEGVETWDVLDAIASLVAKSMVTADDTSEGTTRFQMLETMRQYALDRLDEEADTDAWRRRHAGFYTTRSEQLGRAMKGPDELASRRHVAADLDNIRAAVTWALDSPEEPDTELGLRIVAAFAGDANRSVSPFGVGSWAERALPAAEHSANRALRTDVLSAAGWSILTSGDIPRARELALTALEGGLSPDTSAPSLPFVLLGYIELVQGDLVAASENAAAGIAALDVLDGDHLFERAMMRVSNAAFLAFGAYTAETRTAVDELLAMARELGNPSLLANSLMIDVVATWVADPARAEPLLDEAIRIVEQGGGAAMFGIMQAIRAQLRLGADDVDGARASIVEGLARTGDVGDLPQLVTVCEYAVPVLVAAGSADAAAVVAGFAIDSPYAPLGNMPPDVKPRRDGALDRARLDLGKERYAAARARGAAMGADEAVAFAVDALV